MSEYLFLLPVSVALLLGVMSPGPSFLLVSQTAISRSREAGICVSFGMGTGSLIFTALAALGLYVVLESVPALYTTLKIMGGLYLCYLAYRLWKNNSAKDNHTAPLQKKTSRSKFYLTGLFTQLSNPKTAIVFASVYATFLPHNIPEHSYSILCAMAFTIDTSWYVLVSILLSSGQAQHLYTKYRSVFDRLSGTVLGLIGINLIFRQH